DGSVFTRRHEPATKKRQNVADLWHAVALIPEIRTNIHVSLGKKYYSTKTAPKIAPFHRTDFYSGRTKISTWLGRAGCRPLQESHARMVSHAQHSLAASLQKKACHAQRPLFLFHFCASRRV